MPQPSVGRLPAPSVQQAGLLPGVAFIVTVIAIAFWAAPLASSLGSGVVELGLMLALPLTLALQWGLQSVIAHCQSPQAGGFTPRRAAR